MERPAGVAGGGRLVKASMLAVLNRSPLTWIRVCTYGNVPLVTTLACPSPVRSRFGVDEEDLAGQWAYAGRAKPTRAPKPAPSLVTQP